MNDLIVKLDQILSGLTSCRLDFQSSELINSDDWNESELQRLMANEALGTKYINGKNPDILGVPVYMHGRFAGLAVVRGRIEGSPLNPASFAELLSTLIELRMTSETRSSALISFEERLRIQEGFSGNVTPIRPTRLSQVRAWRNQLEENENRKTSKGQVNNIRMTGPMLLEDMDPEDAKRVALNLHEISGRWAFLSISDLAPETFESTDSLHALGGVTLFIEDLSLVTTSQQIRLAELLSRSPSDDSPTIIACMSSEDRDKVMPHLLEMLQTSQRVRVEDPNRAHIIPFDLRLLDQDQAPVH